jgi:hypothetical protein
MLEKTPATARMIMTEAVVFADDGPAQLFQRELFGDQKPVKKAVHGGSDPRFRRGEDAAHNPENDDHRHDQGADGMIRGDQEFLERSAGEFEIVFSAAEQDGVDDHEPDPDHDPRHESAEEQFSHRKLRVIRVHDHRDARRDDGADGRGGGDDRHGVILAVPLLDHGRDHDRPDGRGVRDAGALDARKDHRGDDAHVAEAAFEASDQGVGEIDDFFRNLRFHHDVPGQDEEGNRHEAEGVDSPEGLDGNHRQRDTQNQHRRQGGDDE